MSGIDFARVIADVIAERADHGEFPGSTRLLAAKVSELCPDCEGTGDRMYNGECFGACGHPNAPTIAKLLAIGAAVMTATWGSMPHADGREHLSVTLANGKTHRYAWLMLDDLKAVQ